MPGSPNTLHSRASIRARRAVCPRGQSRSACIILAARGHRHRLCFNPSAAHRYARLLGLIAIQFNAFNQETIMQWTTPAYTDLRFGFEITMYIANR